MPVVECPPQGAEGAGGGGGGGATARAGQGRFWGRCCEALRRISAAWRLRLVSAACLFFSMSSRRADFSDAAGAFAVFAAGNFSGALAAGAGSMAALVHESWRF